MQGTEVQADISRIMHRVRGLVRPCRRVLRYEGAGRGARLVAGPCEPDHDVMTPVSEEAAPESAGLILIQDHGACDGLGDAIRGLGVGGMVVVAGAESPRFDALKRSLIAVGHVGPDGPGGSHVWVGAVSESEDPEPEGVPPLVVSYFTANTPYEREARGLAESCARVGVPCEIRPIEPRGTWEANCAAKARFMLKRWRESDRPIVWLDADARLERPLALLHDLGADFAVHLVDGWKMASGTVWFNKTPGALRLLERWAARCDAEPGIWDQVHLDLAWEEIAGTSGLLTRWLPERYCAIFDREGASREDVVVRHTQASRRLKTVVSGGRVSGTQEPTEDIRRARLASRPRPVPTDARASVEASEPPVGYSWLPEPVKAVLIGRAARRLMQRGHRRIAIFGAGRHTERVGLGPWREAGLEPFAIVDESARTSCLLGLPVVRPAELAGSDAVVVSSDAHEVSMAARAAVLFPGTPVETIYGHVDETVWAEALGVRSDGEPWLFDILAPLVEAACALPGDLAEFGVYRGETFGGLLHVARKHGRRCHAFDSFKGMAPPTERDNGAYPAGHLSIGGVGNFPFAGAPGAVMHPGYIPESLEGVDASVRFCFVHVDLDHYAPTLEALRWIWPRLTPGGTVACHDFFPGSTVHATPAIDAFMASVGVRPAGVEHESVWFHKPER